MIEITYFARSKQAPAQAAKGRPIIAIVASVAEVVVEIAFFICSFVLFDCADHHPGPARTRQEVFSGQQHCFNDSSEDCNDQTTSDSYTENAY